MTLCATALPICLNPLQAREDKDGFSVSGSCDSSDDADDTDDSCVSHTLNHSNAERYIVCFQPLSHSFDECFYSIRCLKLLIFSRHVYLRSLSSQGNFPTPINQRRYRDEGRVTLADQIAQRLRDAKLAKKKARLARDCQEKSDAIAVESASRPQPRRTAAPSPNHPLLPTHSPEPAVVASPSRLILQSLVRHRATGLSPNSMLPTVLSPSRGIEVINISSDDSARSPPKKVHPFFMQFQRPSAPTSPTMSNELQFYAVARKTASSNVASIPKSPSHAKTHLSPSITSVPPSLASKAISPKQLPSVTEACPAQDPQSMMSHIRARPSGRLRLKFKSPPRQGLQDHEELQNLLLSYIKLKILNPSRPKPIPKVLFPDFDAVPKSCVNAAESQASVASSVFVGPHLIRPALPTILFHGSDAEHHSIESFPIVTDVPRFEAATQTSPLNHPHTLVADAPRIEAATQTSPRTQPLTLIDLQLELRALLIGLGF